jgi:glycosyltransferase involved in cell wall biosynthesis
MRIAFVALTRGQVSGGFKKYIARLVPLLRAHPGVESVDVFVPERMAREGEHSWPSRDELRGFVELRTKIARIRPDVVFIPTARLLRVDQLPVVTMVRNMEPLEVPFDGNKLLEGFKNLGRAAAARSASRHSDRVIAVSDHVRDFIVEHWRISAERVGVIRHGVDPPPAPGPKSNAIPTELENEGFLFTAGSIRPARGLQDVIEALADPRIPSHVKLVIAGGVDAGAEHYSRRMRGLTARLGLEGRVIWLGQLDERSMSWCLRHARLFVMTSRAEACPNTVLEALAHGAVSVSTNHPPMPEFFGDAAAYYQARSSGDLAAQIVRMLSLSDAERDLMSGKAVARATLFTWEATAQATVSELGRAMLRE